LQDGTNGEVKKKALSYTQITFMQVWKEILAFIAFQVHFCKHTRRWTVQLTLLSVPFAFDVL
jgi:hypothetical protein